MVAATLTLALLLGADPVEVTLKKDGDTAKVATDDQRSTITITSQSGIGTATLRPGKEGWPKQLRLAIGVKALEGFNLQNDAFRVHTFLGNERPEVFRRRGDKWEPVEVDAELAPKIRKSGDRILIDVPPSWLEKTPNEIQVEWIDFYRG